MPVRLDELPALGSVLIADDRPCRSCGYNLNGLRTDSKCPECGIPIRKPRVKQFADQMSAAPMVWLAGFRRGTLLLTLGGWGLFLGMCLWALTDAAVFVGAALLGSIVWTFGAVLATRPRPRTKLTTFDPNKEWRILRHWGRWSQPLWTVGLFAVVWRNAMIANLPVGWTWGPPPPMTVFLADLAACSLIAAAVGCWPLMAILSNLAYWASDTTLSNKLRIVSWTLGPGLAIAAGAMLLGHGWFASASFGATPLGPITLLCTILFVFVWGAVLLLTLGYPLLALWQLWRMACWAMVNHMNVEMKDERLRERARQARAPAKPV